MRPAAAVSRWCWWYAVVCLLLLLMWMMMVVCQQCDTVTMQRYQQCQRWHFWSTSSSRLPASVLSSSTSTSSSSLFPRFFICHEQQHRFYARVHCECYSALCCDFDELMVSSSVRMMMTTTIYVHAAASLLLLLL